MEAGVICILLAHFGAFNFGELKTLFYSTMYTLCRTWSLLRAIAGNTSHIKIFLIVRIQFIYVWTVNLCNTKDMSQDSIFHNLTWKFSAFYKFSETNPSP